MKFSVIVEGERGSFKCQVDDINPTSVEGIITIMREAFNGLVDCLNTTTKDEVA